MSERYLANENFPAAIVRALRAQGDDVLNAAETLMAAPDETVIRAAVEQDRVLLTFDRDFAELVFRHQTPSVPGIVLFRLSELSPEGLLAYLRAFFESKPTFRGFFTVASPGHVRQIKLEPSKDRKT